MTIGFIFWLLMLIWLIFGFFLGQPVSIGNTTVPPWGGHLFQWVLLALLGWGTFGFPIHQ
jgi:hypothetical protein